MTPTLSIRLAQGLLGLLGAVVLFGSTYFSLVDPPEPVDGVDWLVAAWAFATGVACIVIAVQLRRGGDRMRRAALVLVASHVAFGLVKLIGYHEDAALTFMAVDAVLVGLLSLPLVRTHFRPAA